jgi:putative peptidoglycan lipid II flippase
VVPTADDLSGGTYVRNAAVMTVGTVLSRATGVIRVGVLAWAMGITVSGLADTYNAANTAPNILYELALGGVLTSVFVPVFVQWRKEHGREQAWDVADRILTLTTILLAALAVAGIVLAPWLMRLYFVAAPDDAQAKIELGTYLVRWFMPQVVFYGIGAIAAGMLNAEGRFAAPMFAPILNNLVVISAVVAYASIHGDAPTSIEEITGTQKLLLGAGTTLGVVAMTVALWPSLRAVGYRWHPKRGWRHPAVDRLIRLSAWVFLYVAANQLAYQIVIVLNNSIEQGALAAYQWAFLIFTLPHAVFAVSIITALLPGMAERWTGNDRAGLITLFSRGVRDTSVIAIPAAFGFLALAVPITRLVLERGLTSTADAELVARVLQAFAVGLPFFSLFQLFTRTFYAMQDSRTPAFTNIAAATVHIGASVLFVFVFGWGVPGMALGHAASYLFGSAILLVILRGRVGSIDGRRIAGTVGRTLPAGLLTGLAAFVVAEVVDDAAGAASGTAVQLMQVSLGVLAGVLVFAGAAAIFGIREVRDVASALRRRFRR